MKRFQCLLLFALIIIGCKEKLGDTTIKSSFSMSESMLQTSKFVEVKREKIKTEMKFYGKITTDNNKLIEVFPIVGGNVVDVFVELGDYVEKGKTLAIIKSTEVAEFDKELANAENDYIVAQKNYKVVQDLFEGKLNSERDMAVAKSEMDKALNELNRIKEIYNIYSLKVGSIYEVKAPISGFVIQKNINKDMQLRSDRTDNIFDIAQIDEVWALANVNESDISQIKMGVNAEVKTISYPDISFNGKVDKIYNIIDPETKAMKVRVKINNADYKLKPDMMAIVRLYFDEDEEAECVPAEAVIFDKSKHFVMVFKDRYNVYTREITVIKVSGDKAFIKGKIKPGEKVFVKNQLLIYDELND